MTKKTTGRSMAHPRLGKIIRDLRSNGIRSLLMVFAIAIGITGFGSILVTYSIMTRELDEGFMNINPPSAIIGVDRVDESTVRAIREIPGIADVEAHTLIEGRIRVGEAEWRTVLLFVYEDYTDIRIGLIKPETGNYPPKEGEIFLERQALAVAKASVGENVEIKSPSSGLQASLKLAGTLHDPLQAPAWMEAMVYGYISRATLARLGEPAGFNEIRIVVSPQDRMDKARIRSTVTKLEAWLAEHMIRVERTTVPEPGKHIHWRQMSGLLFLQAAFGILTLILSSLLVVNMITSLMSAQIRQIGVMKAIGGTTSKIMNLYFMSVLLVGATALVLALPLSLAAGRAYAAFSIGILNFTMASDAVPLWVIALEAIVGLFVPLLIAAYPVFRGSRITIREAISDYGVKNNGRRNQNEKRNRVIFSFIPRSFLMSLRNTFRKRGRILLTLFTLVMGGAIFIGTLIIKDSLANNIDSWIATQPYQLEFRFSGRYDARDLEKAMRDAPGVGRAEGLLVVGAVPVGKEGGSGNPLVVAAPFNASAYADYPLSSGRWFSERETNALVINQIVEDPQKGWVTGGRVSLRIGGVTAEWEIVGSVKQLDDPVVFASFPGVAAASGRDKLINAVAINVLDSGTQSVKALERDLETRLERAGFQIKEGKSVFLRKEILDEHLVIITFFMMAASILALAVGGMGLASMLSVSVFERRREIGIMRAVGASGRSVMGIIVSEGIIIGLISFLFACLLSLPLAFVVGNMVSNTLQSITLDFVFPPGAFIAWLLGVIGLSIAASIFPARQAALLTVREAVSYE